jgi:hypothetical protein
MNFRLGDSFAGQRHFDQRWSVSSSWFFQRKRQNRGLTPSGRPVGKTRVLIQHARCPIRILKVPVPKQRLRREHRLAPAMWSPAVPD